MTSAVFARGGFGTSRTCNPARPAQALSGGVAPWFREASRSTRRRAMRTVVRSAAATESLPAPAGTTGLPFLGETLEIVKSPIGFFEGRAKQYGPVFKTHFAGEECVAVTDATLIQEVLASEHRTVLFETMPSMTKLTESKLFGGIGKEAPPAARKTHRGEKQFMMQFFSPEAIRSYYPYMEQTMRERIAAWAAESQVELVEESKSFAFDVMNTQLGGVQFSKAQLEELDLMFADFVNGATDLFSIDLPGTPFRKGQIAANRIDSLIEEALRASYPELDTNRDIADKNMAASYLKQRTEDGSTWKYTVTDVAKMMRNILFAGHETTAGAICVMLQFLTKNPAVMERATAVEVLRLQHVDDTTRTTGVLFRRAIADFELGGRKITKGSKVMLCLAYATYKLESFLPTAKDFEPERWMNLNKSPANAQKTTGVSPFGGGSRICAGEALALAEMKVFLSMIARLADWTFVNPDAAWKQGQGSLMKIPEDKMVSRITLRKP
eukprot:jgi/Tetstr1/450174/TSEL_037215.t1